MRLIIAVVVYVVVGVAYLAKIPPINRLNEIEGLLLSVVLGIWALAEAYWTLREITAQREQRNRETGGTGIPAGAGGSQVERAPQPAVPARDSALLEAERDELRSRTARLTLQHKELEEVAAMLKRKLTEAERSKLCALDEQAIARQAVLSLLGTLQERGRLVDFLMDEVSAYSDQQVGAAARVVHQGCSAALREQLAVAPIHQGAEGAAATLAQGYNTGEWRLVGKVAGQPPFRGTVLHRGWKAERINLARAASPQASNNVIAPAELEIE